MFFLSFRLVTAGLSGWLITSFKLIW